MNFTCMISVFFLKPEAAQPLYTGTCSSICHRCHVHLSARSAP
jgi:hypothetical protein